MKLKIILKDKDTEYSVETLQIDQTIWCNWYDEMMNRHISASHTGVYK